MYFLKTKWLIAVGTIILLMLSESLFAESLSVISSSAKEKLSLAKVNDRQQVNRGKFVYNRFCSFCHGINLQGQDNWRMRKANGRLPAPPHDETGHTWHHADKLLFGIIKFGLVPPYAPEKYESDMPAWEDTLKDEDIWAVLAYIKTRWPAENRQIQADINRDSEQ